MKYGLSEKQLKEIKDILASYPEVEEAVLFGSRAIDTYKEASDVDIAVRGKKVNWSLAAKIKDHLEEETYLPFFFDIIAYNTIKSDELKKHINTKGKTIYSRKKSVWKVCELGEVAQLEKGSWKVGDEELPYIALEHIVEGGLRLQGIGDSNTIASNKYRFNSDCFLFGKLRPYFRKLYRPGFEGICSTDIWVVKPKGENDKDFLFYFFANQEFVDFTYSGSSGTRMPRADWEFVSKSKWNFAHPIEQKAIAEVLSSLDDKIDLLHRQNKTLEAMAETLFRQWFIEEAKEDWEEEKLGCFLQPQKGRNITKSEAIDGEYPVVAGGLEPSCYHNKSNTKAPVITVSASGANAGFIRLYNTPVWSSDSSFIDKTITSFIFTFYIFLKISQDLLFDKQEGSAQPHVYPSHIMDLDILKYPESILIKFEDLIRPYFGKIKINQNQIYTLEKLRDTLLPKLMSGEVRVE